MSPLFVNSMNPSKYMAGRLYCAAFSNVHHDPASVPHLPVRPVAAEADREADVAHVLHRM